jgi:hypothetical protein
MHRHDSSRLRSSPNPLIDILEKIKIEKEQLIIEGKGSISAKQAEQKAFGEYDKFNKTQEIESDFDKAVKALEKQYKSKR